MKRKGWAVVAMVATPLVALSVLLTGCTPGPSLKEIEERAELRDQCTALGGRFFDSSEMGYRWDCQFGEK